MSMKMFLYHLYTRCITGHCHIMYILYHAVCCFYSFYVLMMHSLNMLNSLCLFEYINDKSDIKSTLSCRFTSDLQNPVVQVVYTYIFFMKNK